ncbi:hypothetical protein AYX14_05774 [Cryptococcus neoformans]|nr:hypothetical protein AYX14_05774 [Cryptococcus neoformans var. grubii]
MVKAVIQVILELAVTEDRQALCWRVCDKHYLLPVETSSSQLCKNVKTLYGQLDIDPSMVVHDKCPTKECQNVFVDVVGKGGWDEVPNSCPECGTALREGRKLVTEFFPCCTLQAKLEYLFSLDGIEQLVKDHKFCTLGKGNVMSRWRGWLIFKMRIQERFSIISWMDHATRSMIRMSSMNMAVWSSLSTFLSTGQPHPSPAIIPLDPWALSSHHQ